MGFINGKIVLDSDKGIYFAGQTLHGNLVFRQDKVQTFRGMYVEVKGSAYVHWTTRRLRTSNNQTRLYTVNHDADEEYFRVKHYLVGGPKGEYELQPGDHDFPFECQIPPDCPSSFEGTYGSVEYRIKVVVDRQLKFDQKKERTFKVKAPLKLNPNDLKPMEFSFEDTYCGFWCVNAGSCQTVVKLPQSGFCIGQTVPVQFSCNNTSSVTIKQIKLQIVKVTTFTAYSAPGTRDEEEEIVELTKGPIPAGANRSWLLQLSIPVMDPCNLDECSIIDVDYYLEVKVKTSGCHQNSEQSQGTVIGDVPLSESKYFNSNRLQ